MRTRVRVIRFESGELLSSFLAGDVPRLGEDLLLGDKLYVVVRAPSWSKDEGTRDSKDSELAVLLQVVETPASVRARSMTRTDRENL